MSYVQVINLAYTLHEIRPASLQYLNCVVDLSGIALAKFHTLFRRGMSHISIDSAAHEDDINQFLDESQERMGKCNLKIMVTSLLDFTSWNIVLKDDHIKRSMMLYLIDFRRLDYVCPHLDLAQFRFGMELIKQIPPAKFFGLNHWDADYPVDRF